MRDGHRPSRTHASRAFAGIAADVFAASGAVKQSAVEGDGEGVALRGRAQCGKQRSKPFIDLVSSQAEPICDAVGGRSIGQHPERIPLARCDVKYQRSFLS